MPVKLIWKDDTKKIRKFAVAKMQNLVKVRAEKVILLVGAAGAGKSTLINGEKPYFYNSISEQSCDCTKIKT